jgi:hypothetical protein
MQKARKAVELKDLPLALHLGRASVESAYLAYLASEGFSYLGMKWPAQVSQARGAQERVSRHPMLGQGLPLLFPTYTLDGADILKYLQAVASWIVCLRKQIEQKVMFRIAFETCPQIHPLVNFG